MALLEINNLTKSFGGLMAVHNCTFSVEESSITALIGPNGAGKTTVFNLISGILPNDSGQVIFNGERIEELPPHKITRKGLSRTFQISRDLMEMSVIENLIVHSPTQGLLDLLKGSILKQELDQAMELLEFVGITHLAHAKAKSLSYGQKKLMEFAATLMTEPRMILLDEPAGGINPALLENIMEKITEVNKRGVTFLIVEHNMDVVMNLCNPVVVMAYGEVLAQGTPDAVQNNPQVLEAYLGGGA
jgi:branched-chain amino acid transport system ATP-binding protein